MYGTGTVSWNNDPVRKIDRKLRPSEIPFRTVMTLDPMQTLPMKSPSGQNRKTPSNSIMLVAIECTYRRLVVVRSTHCNALRYALRQFFPSRTLLLPLLAKAVVTSATKSDTSRYTNTRYDYMGHLPLPVIGPTCNYAIYKFSSICTRAEGRAMAPLFTPICRIAACEDIGIYGIARDL